MTIDSQRSEEPGDLQAAHHPLHLLRHRLVSLPVRVVERGQNEVLKHLDVILRDRLWIDLDRVHLLGAVHDDGDHAPARRRFDPQLGHLLLHAFLHLLGLLHHALDVHGVILSRKRSTASWKVAAGSYISSTSRISAAKTSSIAWTPESASACSRSAAFRSAESP